MDVATSCRLVYSINAVESALRPQTEGSDKQ